MAGLVRRFVHCMKDGGLVVAYPLPQGITLGRTVPASYNEPIEIAKRNLMDELLRPAAI